MHHHHHDHNSALVILSVVIAIVSSYVALDLASSLSATRKRSRAILIGLGSFAMGVGIWSMHFVGMLAFRIDKLEIAYDIPLMILSIVVAIVASGLALSIVGREKSNIVVNMVGALFMGGAIAGMHYIGIASMRLAATISWDHEWVIWSIVIAIVASFVSLILSFKLRNDYSFKGIIHRILAGTVMGFAISGMHYTGMMAMSFHPTHFSPIDNSQLLATDGLAITVVLGTVIVLGIAIWGAAVDRAFTRRILMTEALEAAIKSRDNFLSIASHELKTPLTSIKLHMQLMSKQLKVGGQADINRFQRMLNQTDHSVNRLNRLVDDMLDISRLNANKLVLQIEEFELTEMVEDIIERLRPSILEFNSDVAFYSDAKIVGSWDRFRLEQVMANLLTNAGRYGLGRPIEVKVHVSEGLAQVHVKDQGRGIALEDQERIFQRFERAISSDEVSGMGLGLFIVQEIIFMHKGTIKVVSDLGEGAEFIVSLPIHTA